MAQHAMSAQAIRDLVKKKGMLGKQLYIVHTTPTGDLDAVLAVIEDHLAFQVDLESRGIMFAAGPNWTEDEQEWRGDGTVVIRANSMNQAREIMAADPMHKSGARRYEIRPWLVNEGKLTVEISYSSGAVKVL
jgi:uncharacterized protein YciI